MTEHLSDGKFASREVTGAPKKKRDKRGRLVKGTPGGPGRPPGVPNKLTRDVKEFLAALVASVRVQDAVEARIEKGDAVAFFRALEHVVGKPKENVDLNISGSVDLVSRLAAGRKRVADARKS